MYSDWAGLQNLLPPNFPTQSPFQDYFDEFEAAPTVPDALDLPLPGQMMSESQAIPGMQIPPQFPQQSVQQFPRQGVQQHLQYYPQQGVQQHPQQSVQYHQQAVQQYPQQAIPQYLQQVQQHPQQIFQPTPGLAHQRFPSQGYIHPAHLIHPQISHGAHIGANDQAIPTHQPPQNDTPQNDMAQISPSSIQNPTTAANTPSSQGGVDAHNQITPQSQTSGAYQPGCTIYNAEENADM